MAKTKRHDLFTKKERRYIRSRQWPDMRPHIFDRVAEMIPNVFTHYFDKHIKSHNTKRHNLT